jgi:hypothetical protein
MRDDVDDIHLARKDVVTNRANGWRTTRRDRDGGTPNEGRIEDKGGKEKRRC